MTPDTAALRALADEAAAFRRLTPEWHRFRPEAGSVLVDPDTVRALCDAADEMERLRAAVVERIDFTIGVERIAQAIDAAWQEAHAADRNDGGYLDGYLDGLEHAEGIVRTTLANPTTTEADA